MTIQQFKSLTPEQQRAACDAHNRLACPYSMAPSGEAQRQRRRLPRQREHVPEEKMIELGGSCSPSRINRHMVTSGQVDEKSGITCGQAQRFMKAAKEAERYNHDGHTLEKAG